MGKAIICPVCGNKGEATLEDTGAFEVRGQFEGKAVRRCNKCGSGLLVGPFSGGFFGKPKIVPIPLWEHMQKVWQNEFESDPQKQSIPISQVVDELAKMTITSSSIEKISEAIQAALSSEKPPDIDDHMRKEWLILHMLAATYGVQKADIPSETKRKIQDHFHYVVYHMEFSSETERESFEGIVRKRYSTYWEILNKQDEGVNVFEELGRSFLKEFMQSTDIILNILVSKLFVAMSISNKKYIEDVSKKFEITS